MKMTLIPALAATMIAFGWPASGSADPRTVDGQPASAHAGRHLMHASSHGYGTGSASGASPMAGERMGGGGRMHSGMHGGGMMSERGWLQGLGLSETQRDKVFEIMHAQAPKIREQGKAVRAARAELAVLSTASSLEAAQLKAASERLARAVADMSESRVKTRNQIFQLLTPEQRKQVEARLAHRQQHGAHGSGMRHDGHPRSPGQQPGQTPGAPGMQRS